jgi:hypothetical protein
MITERRTGRRCREESGSSQPSAQQFTRSRLDPHRFSQSALTRCQSGTPPYVEPSVIRAFRECVGSSIMGASVIRAPAPDLRILP